MITRAANPMLHATAIALSLALLLFFFFSSPFSVVAADGISKLPSSGPSSGAFMPFVFGGVHTQKEKSPAYLEEVTEPRYVVEVSSVPKKKTSVEEEGGASSPSSSPSSSSSSSASKSQKRTVTLADRAGRPFECTIPAVPSSVDDDDGYGESSSGGEKQGGNSNNNNSDPSPASLLRSLEGACLYRIEDSWWTYELCFERHVRQFHREGPGGGASAEFWLGKWGGGSSGGDSGGSSNHYNVSISRDRGEAASSFVSSTYGGGDPCDLLAGRPRTTEVKFVCLERPAPTAAPQPQPQQQPPGGGQGPPPAAAAAPPPNLVQPPPNVILSAKELSTCSYEVVVGVDALCRHGGFRAAEPATATIECRPVAAE